MRSILLLMLLLAGAFLHLHSQVPRATAATIMAKHPVEVGLFAAGGFAVSDHVYAYGVRSPAQLDFANAGIELEKVLTHQHGDSPLRGTFEFGANFMPFWYALYPHQKLTYNLPSTTLVDPNFGFATYGRSLTPAILRWNFTRNAKQVPWVQVACGVLWTDREFPSNGTSSVNFTPQVGFGYRLFNSRRTSLNAYVNAVHISNGNTADLNPGVPVTVQYGVGLSWWR